MIPILQQRGYPQRMPSLESRPIQRSYFSLGEDNLTTEKMGALNSTCSLKRAATYNPKTQATLPSQYFLKRSASYDSKKPKIPHASVKRLCTPLLADQPDFKKRHTMKSLPHASFLGNAVDTSHASIPDFLTIPSLLAFSSLNWETKCIMNALFPPEYFQKYLDAYTIIDTVELIEGPFEETPELKKMVSYKVLDSTILERIQQNWGIAPEGFIQLLHKYYNTKSINLLLHELIKNKVSFDEVIHFHTTQTQFLLEFQRKYGAPPTKNQNIIRLLESKILSFQGLLRMDPQICIDLGGFHADFIDAIIDKLVTVEEIISLRPETRLLMTSLYSAKFLKLMKQFSFPIKQVNALTEENIEIIKGLLKQPRNLEGIRSILDLF